MYAPVVRKIINSKDVLIERALPVKGVIHVDVGEKLRPFDHLGQCVVSHAKLDLPVKFQPKKLDKKVNKHFVYLGADIGKVGQKKVTAPFNGYLVKAGEERYTFEEEPHKHLLLSGVWGDVAKIKEGVSVLIKTQTKDIQLTASTHDSFVGELIVFPNNKDFLEKFYLIEVAAKARGKIIYAGHFADLELIQRARELGVGVLIAGSAGRDVFTYAKRKKVRFATISGFGKIETPADAYTLLSKVGERLIFYQGERNLLRIPVTPDEIGSTTKSPKVIKKVAKDMRVQIFQHPYIGVNAVVDKVLESSIVIKLSGDKNPVEVFIPNFYILE